MNKHCWFCKNTENFFLQQKEELLQSIDKELFDYDNFEKSIVDITKEKFGFTDEQKDKVKSIKPEFTSITMSAVLENKDSFIKLEPNLEIIINYYSKFINKNFKFVNEVIQNFLSEPIEDRYKGELVRNSSNKKLLLERKAKLEEIKTFFIEKEITPQKIYTTTKSIFNFQNLGFNFSKRIFICPFCASLLAEASNASFEVIEAQKRAQDNWDDDDWDDDDFN